MPPELIAQFQSYAGGAQTITEALGCLFKRGFLNDGGWNLWFFERGMIGLGNPMPPGNRFVGAWIEGRTGNSGGRLRVAWKKAEPNNWFRIHVYDRNVSQTGGEPPGGWLDPLLITGNPDSRAKHTDGDGSFDLAAVDQPTSWDVLIVGCSKEIIAGVATGHDCIDNILPKLTVEVGPEPKQAFSCAAPPPPFNPLFQAPRSEGIVLEVGSCRDSPYGLFVYEWDSPCPNQSAVLSRGTLACPDGVSDYGFIVVAPSRGWTADQFRAKVEFSMAAWRGTGNGYLPGGTAAVDVPVSPPVIRNGDKWVVAPGGASSQHTVTFRWSAVAGTRILDDTGAPGLFGPAALGADLAKWPTAIGHVSARDGSSTSGDLIRSSGSGCLTIAGFPTPDDQDPPGLVIDLRDIKRPLVLDRQTSELGSFCN